MASEVVRAVLNHVWNALESLGHPCALMGGLALAAWNHPRATRDVDLLLGVGSEDINEVIETLQKVGCRPKHDPALTTVGAFHFAQLLYTPPNEVYDVQFDLWLADSELYQSAISRRVRRDIPGLLRPIDVLSCDDLILFKLIAGRMIDRADVAMLLRENRDAIDIAYLLNWSQRLELTQDLAEIWKDALPDEPMPALQ